MFRKCSCDERKHLKCGCKFKSVEYIDDKSVRHDIITCKEHSHATAIVDDVVLEENDQLSLTFTGNINNVKSIDDLKRMYKKQKENKNGS